MSQGLRRLYLIGNQMRFHSLNSSSSRDKARSPERPASLTFVTLLPFVEPPAEGGLGLTHTFLEGGDDCARNVDIFLSAFARKTVPASP